MKAILKLHVNEWVEFFREELPTLGLKVPPEPVLCGLIRGAFRSGKRLLRYYGRSFFHDRPGFMHERIRNYVVSRLLYSNDSAAWEFSPYEVVESKSKEHKHEQESA